jgi:diguanylate cyclase (GGDEF)-like protein
MAGKLEGGAQADPAHVRKALENALIESERIKGLMDQAATDISCITRVITEAMLESPQIRIIEDSLRRISEANSKVRLASAKLAEVHVDLRGQARDRDMLDHRFAAAVEQNESTRHAALHDVLTGLPNRALFNDRLQVAISQARKSGWSVAVMFVDLDDFKAINDSFGHALGDRLLQTIARRLKTHTREDDTVSRYGGDEFLYLANHVRDDNNIKLIAEKLMKEIEAPLDISVPDRPNFKGAIHASVGIAVFPKDGSSPDLLVRNADAAMYHAKSSQSGLAFTP